MPTSATTYVQSLYEAMQGDSDAQVKVRAIWRRF